MLDEYLIDRTKLNVALLDPCRIAGALYESNNDPVAIRIPTVTTTSLVLAKPGTALHVSAESEVHNTLGVEETPRMTLLCLAASEAVRTS